MARVPLTIERISFTKLKLNVASVGLSPKQFERLCRDNRELRFELTAQKEIVIMPPAALKTAWKETEIVRQLANWAKVDGSGLAFNSNAGFTLSNGAVRAPDAWWMRREKWNALSNQQKESFAEVAPDFVIELRSRNETVAELQEKMLEYIDNGVPLGWLIEPVRQKVYIYRANQRSPEILDKPIFLNGDPLLPGFTLQLAEIW